MFKNLINHIISLLTVGKHIFKKPVTLEYPEKKRNVGDNFRGKPVIENCIGCTTCLQVCPTGAIAITEDNFVIDLKKCIFCGNCSYYCPKGAIKMSKDYELACDNSEYLKLVYKRGEEKDV